MENDQKSIISKILTCIDDKLGEDPMVLDVHRISSVCDYFVIASASSLRQVKAIVDEIEDELSEQNIDLIRKEGHNSKRWVLLDYGDIVIHIFHKEDRQFYNLEKIWKDAEILNIDIN